mmetsp:Transcript_23809/g.49429  ORF Transcript_23809/g.49429 Transcript_23809/m.49429 type:complete len:233 (-) Transcript_23809:3-701(-)
MQTAAKCDSTLLRLHLHITHQRIIVGGNNHVHILNGIAETRIHVLCFHLQLQNAAVHLVHKQAGPHTLLKSLAQDRLSLDSAALNAINHHHCAIGDSKSCSHFRGEVHVTWGVNQVDQVRNSSLTILLIMLEVQRHAGAFDGHATLLFIRPGVGEARISRRLGADDASLADQGICQGGFAVIHMCDDTHGADIIRLVHDLSHLVHREVRHGRMKAVAKLFGTTRLQSMTGTA